MKTFGIRQAKAHLSALVCDAAKGDCSLITDNRKPVAMIAPPPQDAAQPMDEFEQAIKALEPK